MASTTHKATAEDDRRHTPGTGSLALWNESYWFAFYDTQTELGVTVRIGMYPNKDEGNLYLLFARGREIVHSVVDPAGPFPSWNGDAVSAHNYTLAIEQPPECFRLRYDGGDHGMDVVWEGCSPTYAYPVPPESTAEQIPRHLEHGGTVTGTVTVAGETHRIDCLGHRDHSWGGERDWSKMPRWEYLSGEIDKRFWFNAVQVWLTGLPEPLYRGGLWDGNEVLDLADVRMTVQTENGGTRQTGVDLHLEDERGRKHHIVSEEVLAIAPVQFGRTWIKDGFTRYRYGDRVGMGILEIGYREE
jgi:hypothetical protein